MSSASNIAAFWIGFFLLETLSLKLLLGRKKKFLAGGLLVIDAHENPSNSQKRRFRVF